MSYRTHKCGKIDSKLAGTEVEVVGWVNKKGKSKKKMEGFRRN